MRYRIHRMKETPREHFRWAAHTGGVAIVKPRDYDAAEEREAASPYALWKLLAAGESPLWPGDLLESLAEDGSASSLQIAKYIGFEPAQWFVPEPKPDPIPSAHPYEPAIENINSPSVS
ncbi:MAG: hypothetical protein M3Y57_11690 [Acidobacteriota bacterium]|nr:hypothetical protein [Acidobacteriota bacterium]